MNGRVELYLNTERQEKTPGGLYKLLGVVLGAEKVNTVDNQKNIAAITCTADPRVAYPFCYETAYQGFYFTSGL